MCLKRIKIAWDKTQKSVLGFGILVDAGIERMVWGDKIF